MGDEEDLVPHPVFEDPSADVGAENTPDGEDAGEQPDHLRAPVFELVADYPDRRGHQTASTDGLDHTEEDQEAHVGGQPAKERPNGKAADAEHEDPLPPQLIAQLTGERHHDDLHQLITGERPAYPVQAAVERLGQRGDRYRDDAGIDGGHHQSEPG